MIYGGERGELLDDWYASYYQRRRDDLHERLDDDWDGDAACGGRYRDDCGVTEDWDSDGYAYDDRYYDRYYDGYYNNRGNRSRYDSYRGRGYRDDGYAYGSRRDRHYPDRYQYPSRYDPRYDPRLRAVYRARIGSPTPLGNRAGHTSGRSSTGDRGRWE